MDKWTLLLVVVLLVILVVLMARPMVNSCLFQLGDNVVTRHDCSLLHDPAGNEACSVYAEETGVITLDILGKGVKRDWGNFDCWYFVATKTCRGWTLGSNLARH
jgi:hypothetical protein